MVTKITYFLLFTGLNSLKIDPSSLLIYKPVTLTCSSEVDVGTVSGAVWKFKESVILSSLRYKITTKVKQSELEIREVIPNDAGKGFLYTITCK